jgi:DNA-directed RNA polymerase subunit RPC12/RpoP
MIDSANDEIIKSILAGLTEEQKQKLIDQVVGVPEDKPSGERNEQSPKQRGRVNEDFTVNRDLTQKVREPVRAKKNKWTDEGEAHKDIETPMFEKTPRARKPHKMQEVECHACGKSFKIDPSNTYGEYHRCNRCGGGR